MNDLYEDDNYHYDGSLDHPDQGELSDNEMRDEQDVDDFNK